jgi:hypothetical protein
MNVRFNNGLSAAQPNMIEGLEMPEFDPFTVSEELCGAPYLLPECCNVATLSWRMGRTRKGHELSTAPSDVQWCFYGL